MYWAQHQETRVNKQMFLAPQRINWAPINPFLDYTCKLVDEVVLRETCQILCGMIRGKNLWTFRNWYVAHTLEFLTWEEQGQVLRILKEHYVNQQ